ncbi:MAG: hypothetical protein DRP45_06860, partial [Candidatus Zixiibacteriota bacterium]
MTQDSSTNLWKLLEVLAHRRGLMFTLVFLATLTAVVISLVLPKWYTANALLLPPSEQSADGLAQLAQVGLFTSGARFPGMITLNDVYARILQSRRISDRIIERFNLQDQFDLPGKFGLYELLNERAGVQITDEGLLRFSFEDRDPQIAADIATAYVEELVKLNSEILSNSAREQREFIEARLSEVTLKLQVARDELEGFQVDNRAVDLDE